MQPQTISQSSDFAAEGTERRVDLDWVRIGAFGLLIFYHVGMLYVSWGFHVKSQYRITGLEPLMMVLNPWRLALLFLVSGVATRLMLRKYAIGPLIRSRSARLLIPLIFGMLVIVPPQAYEQIVETLGYSGGFSDFYVRHYFAFGPQFCPNPCILLPTWNHLWFVAYLWVYTMALAGPLLAVPGIIGWIERRLAAVLSGAWLLVVPSIMFAAYRLVLLPRFPATDALFGDWYNHALYATVFLIGFLLAQARSFWDAIERQSWASVWLAPVFFLTFLTIWLMTRDAGAPPSLWLKLIGVTAYGFYQWLIIVAVLGFARRWIHVDSAARRYLTEAIFPYYIGHQTAIILIAHALHGRDLPVWCEAGIVIAGTLAVCALSYEIVRRVAVLRPLFGLRWTSPQRPLSVRAGSLSAQ